MGLSTAAPGQEAEPQHSPQDIGAGEAGGGPWSCPLPLCSQAFQEQGAAPAPAGAQQPPRQKDQASIACPEE